jgi:hypothetical protein
MKKTVLMCFLMFLFIGPLGAGSALSDINKEFTFLWEQDAADLPQLKEWRFYWSDTTGGPYTAILDTLGNPLIVLYDGSPSASYTSEQVVVVPGQPGTSVTKYIVMTAVDQSDNESGYSAEAIDNSTGEGFVVIKIPMGRPFSVKVIVKPGNVP